MIDSAQAGDPIARTALARVAEWLGIVMAACVGVLNPMKIVLGGGFGLAAFDWLAPGAKTESATARAAEGLCSPGDRQVRVDFERHWGGLSGLERSAPDCSLAISQGGL